MMATRGIGGHRTLDFGVLDNHFGLDEAFERDAKSLDFIQHGVPRILESFACISDSELLVDQRDESRTDLGRTGSGAEDLGSFTAECLHGCDDPAALEPGVRYARVAGHET